MFRNIWNYIFFKLKNPLTITTSQISLNIISCQDEAGNKISTTVCSTYLRPRAQPNNGCSNLVRNIKYILSYVNPTGIIEAGLDVTFFSYDLTSTSRARQSFEVLFIPSSVPLVINFYLYLNCLCKLNATLTTTKRSTTIRWRTVSWAAIRVTRRASLCKRRATRMSKMDSLIWVPIRMERVLVMIVAEAKSTLATI